MTVCAMDATVRSASARPWHARSYRSSGKDVRTRLNRNRAYYYCSPLQKTVDRTIMSSASGSQLGPRIICKSIASSSRLVMGCRRRAASFAYSSKVVLSRHSLC